MADSDETVSYSEEELQPSEVAAEEEHEEENDSVIAAILQENEKLESEHDYKPKRSGKQRAAKAPTNNGLNEHLLSVILNLQDEVKSLKRGKKSPQRECKKQCIDVTSEDRVRPRSSRNYDNEISPSQLSTGKSKQLSSVQKTQSVSAPKIQLSSVPHKQLSPAKNVSQSIPQVQGDTSDSDDDNDDSVALHVDSDDDDPLAQEQQDVQQQQDDGNSSEEEEDDGNIFDDLVGSINLGGDDDLLCGLPLPDTWAQKVNLAWKTKLQKTSFNTLMLKYRTPSNLTDYKIPRMNKGIWDLCSKWQKKSDLSMSASQRTLVKAVTAVLKLHDYFSNQPRSTRQIAMQTTIDIISFLGKVNTDLTAKRKVAARACLQGDYKNLSTSTSVTENLFGDNMAQDIKDINTIRRIGAANSGYRYNSRRNSRGSGSFRGGYRGYSGNYDSGHFLWRGRGRGRPPYRASQNNYQQSSYQSHTQKKR